jgi:hypothetical protein
MSVKPTLEMITAEFTVPERVLLFCLASHTDWQKAGVTRATAQHMMVRGSDRERGATRYAPLTDQGRAIAGGVARER